MQFSKPSLSILDQIKRLTDRGLKVHNMQRAEKYLSNISYYRLSAYTLPFQKLNDPNHYFETDATFEKVLNSYLFDRELRLIVFDAIERTEIAFRTQLINQYCFAHGSHWYEDPSHFYNNYCYSKNLQKLDEEIDRSGEVFIKHYKTKYTTPNRPPVWMSFEVASMGTLSKIYSDLKMSAAKKRVSDHFMLGHPKVLQSWMHSLCYVRNICAHHSRLWNRVLTLKPVLPTNHKQQWLMNSNIQVNKLYAFLSCLLYMRKVVNPKTSFAYKIRHVLQKFPEIDSAKMGFPAGWEKEPLWK
jgi:abortive infection bacteriophage resistance protein